MSSEPVLVQREGAVTTLILNRPALRTAMRRQTVQACRPAVEAVQEGLSVRAVIVTGAGTAFCSGGDLSWIKPGPGASVPEMRRKMRSFYPRFLAVRSLDVPVIAEINGPAVGAGLCLAM